MKETCSERFEARRPAIKTLSSRGRLLRVRLPEMMSADREIVAAAQEEFIK